MSRWPFLLKHLSCSPVNPFDSFHTWRDSADPTVSNSLDHYSRTIRHVGATPRYLLSDKESMFMSRGYRRWCRRRGIRFRYGAVGKHGSIAIIERFFRTLKNDCTRRILVSFRRGAVHRELALFMRWYNAHRPHGPLGVRTPDEVYGGIAPACERARLEL